MVICTTTKVHRDLETEMTERKRIMKMLGLYPVVSVYMFPAFRDMEQALFTGTDPCFFPYFAAVLSGFIQYKTVKCKR